MTPGTYSPGQVIDGNPFLTRGLALFEEALHEQSCTLVGNEMWDECRVEVLENGTKRYGNYFTDEAMPDPDVTLEIVETQPNLKEYILHYLVANPDNPSEMLIDTEWVMPRHADSNYEEECRFLNKSCATD